MVVQCLMYSVNCVALLVRCTAYFVLNTAYKVQSLPYLYPMKIAVNTRFLLSQKLEGIGWFTYEVFKRLVQNHPEVEWIFIFDRPYNNDFIFGSNVTPVVISPPARHPFLWYMWFEFSIPRVLKKHKPDLFISTDGYLSLKTKTRSLPVIHDINFEHSNDLPELTLRYYRHFFPKFAHKGHRIATVSEFSRKDIAQTYKVDLHKIDVVFNGCGDFFHPLPVEEQAEVKAEISGGSPYFIFIGALNPRKNITGMLTAYELYRKNGGAAKFVIVGEKMFRTDSIAEAYQNHSFRQDIYFTGRLEGAGLNRALASSHGLLFVSNFEGFGIPIVEAFKCQVPVITSTTTSMPEVAGDAALLCHPTDYPQIAEAMHKLDNPAVRNDLIARGNKRANLFTWERSAEMMWESIQKTLAQ